MVPTKSSAEKGCLSSIIVNQLGGSKLERAISVISTEADIAELNMTTKTTRQVSQEMVVVSSELEAK